MNPLLIVSPHPDDEVLGAGGLIRIWRERGHEVAILSVTDGEAAYPDWRGLGEVRRRELDAALATLSSRPIRMIRLGLPDGKVAGRSSDLIHALDELCGSKPTLVAPFEADGHPDHEATAAACLHVAQSRRVSIVRYPVWAWHHAQPEALRGAVWGKFPLDARTREAKKSAINRFASQLNPGDARDAIVPPHILEYFERDYEAFLL